MPDSECRMPTLIVSAAKAGRLTRPDAARAAAAALSAKRRFIMRDLPRVSNEWADDDSSAGAAVSKAYATVDGARSAVRWLVDARRAAGSRPHQLEQRLAPTGRRVGAPATSSQRASRMSATSKRGCRLVLVGLRRPPPIAWAMAAAGFPMPVHDPCATGRARRRSVAEEIVFRGGSQRPARALGERDEVAGHAGELVTSAVFAALHAGAIRSRWRSACSRSRWSTAARELSGRGGRRRCSTSASTRCCTRRRGGWPRR